jgi:hypothetical protein
MIAKVALKYDTSGRRDTRHCELRGCKRATTGRKPFCTDHIEHMPQVRWLRDELQRREDEWEAVRRRGARAVKMEGTTAHEVLQYLKVHGSRTIRRLAKDLSMDLELVTPYVNALRRKRKVRVTENKRGIPLVHYLADDPNSSGSRRKKPAIKAA